jgi:predicted phage terminase large subunit-like protein
MNDMSVSAELADLLRQKKALQEKEAKALQRKLLIESAKLYKHSLAEFVKAAWHLVVQGTELDWNWHLDVMCDYLERVHRREIHRLILNVPPRHTKSTIVSVLYPVWVWAQKPEHQFYCFSHTDDLAIRDALHARRVVESDWFQKHFCDPTLQPVNPKTKKKFPPMRLMADQNAKGRYETSRGGHRLSQGLTGNITGDGGDTILIDDPHDAEKILSDNDRGRVLRTFDDVIMSRLNSSVDGAIIVIMQRLHHMDLTGHLLAKRAGWVHVCLPQEFESSHPYKFPGDKRTKEGELLWPSRVPMRVVEQQKKDQSAYAYAGQRQQRPSPSDGGLLKTQWFRQWPADRPIPDAVAIVDSWDTAFSEQNMKKNSQSAFTRWAIVWHEGQSRYVILLCKSWCGHVAYPSLRARAQKECRDHKPDAVIVEKKASGQSLIQDLRQANIPVLGFQPERDKVARAFAVQAMLQDGLIYVPSDRKFADDVVLQCSQFPNGAYDDLVDTCTQAWLYIRNSFLVEHSLNNPRGDKRDDDDDDDLPVKRNVKSAYG